MYSSYIRTSTASHARRLSLEQSVGTRGVPGQPAVAAGGRSTYAIPGAGGLVVVFALLLLFVAYLAVLTARSYTKRIAIEFGLCCLLISGTHDCVIASSPHRGSIPLSLPSRIASPGGSECLFITFYLYFQLGRLISRARHSLLLLHSDLITSLSAPNLGAPHEHHLSAWSLVALSTSGCIWPGVCPRMIDGVDAVPRSLVVYTMKTQQSFTSQALFQPFSSTISNFQSSPSLPLSVSQLRRSIRCCRCCYVPPSSVQSYGLCCLLSFN